MREETKIMVKILDFSKLFERVKCRCSPQLKNGESIDNIKLCIGKEIGLVKTIEGYYIVFSESSFYALVKKSVPFQFFVKIIISSRKNRKYIRQFGPITYPLSEILKLPVVQQIDLCQFVEESVCDFSYQRFYERVRSIFIN